MHYQCRKSRKGGTLRGMTGSSLYVIIFLVTTIMVRQGEGADEIPPGVQLMPGLDYSTNLPVSSNVLEQVLWPSANEIETYAPREDRSTSILPLLPTNGMADGKPIRRGARSPQQACSEAHTWIAKILKTQWIPGDVLQRLLPLQELAASNSIVHCRYAISNNSIQVSQSVSGIWVVMKPPTNETAGMSVTDLGPFVFERFLTRGHDMGQLSRRELEELLPLHVFLEGQTEPWSKAAAINWWGWVLWYSDGQAVAVLLQKVEEDSQIDADARDPWF